MTVPAVTPVTAAALAFVDDLEAPELAAADRHHLERVRRLRAGTTIVVADGTGAWRSVVLGGRLEPTGEVQRDEAPARPVTVGFAPVKGDRPEWVVQKLTELGVDRIVPLVAERSVVRWDAERGGRQVERWRSVAREAATQCRRTRLPEVSALTEIGKIIPGEGVALADLEGAAPGPDTTTVLVGPEGGWSPAERERAGQAICLGVHVLRAETAALVAGAVLVGLRAGLVAPARTVR